MTRRPVFADPQDVFEQLRCIELNERVFHGELLGQRAEVRQARPKRIAAGCNVGRA